MMPILIIGAVVVIAVSMALIQKSRTGAEWTGRVESISRKTACREQCAQTFVIVRYRTGAGKRGKFELDAGAFARYFPGLKEGDGLVKTAAEGLPRQV
jgi:hypothetical protein